MEKNSGLDLTTLVARAVAGESEAWDAIVDQMNNLVWSVVRSFRLSDADSHDAVQMTWLRAVESLHKMMLPERLGLWLSTIARRECLRIMEKGKRSVPVDPDAAFERLIVPATIEKDMINRQEAQRVIDALLAISESCRQLLRLVLCDPPMMYEDISQALGVAVGTIGPRRQRCLIELRSAARL